MLRFPVERLQTLSTRVITGWLAVQRLHALEKELRPVGMADVARRLWVEAGAVSSRMRDAEESALALVEALFPHGGGARSAEAELVTSCREVLRVRQILEELGAPDKSVAADDVLRLAVERGLDRQGARRALDRLLREG